jgi:hypothetical protein
MRFLKNNMKDYTIQKLNDSDFSVLIPLMKNCFGMDVDLNYFEWKFKNNPAGFVEGYYAVSSDGVVAAYYGAIPEAFMFSGQKQIIYQSCDTMTHSQHRKKGLFQLLALHCYKKLEEENKLFVYGFGGGQSTPGFLKFGWKEVFRMRYYFYPKVFRYLTFRKKDKIVFISDLKEIEHLTIISNTRSSIHACKSFETYKWRTSNPQHTYQTIAIKDENQNYAAYLTYYEESNKIVIFDFYMGQRKLGKKLFSFLKFELKPNQLGLVAFLQENSFNSKTVSSFRFLSNPFTIGPLSEKIPFIIFAETSVLNFFKDKSKWMITSFDHDSI